MLFYLLSRLRPACLGCVRLIYIFLVMPDHLTNTLPTLFDGSVFIRIARPTVEKLVSLNVGFASWLT
ncbi:hypothetical protein FOBRF1_000752 [Fusarium oxysporum]